MMELIKNNPRPALNLAAAAVIAILFAFSYRQQAGPLDMITVSYEKPFKVFDGFTFRVTNNSDMDLGSVKMIIDPKFDPASDFVCYPRRTLYRNGFTLHDTSDFVDSKGAHYTPARGGGAVDIYIECRAADGKFHSGRRKLEYK